MATSSTLASTGIGSGLDVQSIVEKLMSIERKPLDQLTTQKTAFQAKISAYGSLKGALGALDGALANLTSSTFRNASATSSDTTLFTASAADGAVAGSHSIEVTGLAQAQKIVSSGFASTADAVGTGTLTFTFGTISGTTFTPGTGGVKTVTIAPGQDSLAAIRDAINAGNVGVSASIVNDGSTNGQRLVLTSKSTGADQAFTLTVADADGNGTDAAGLSQLAYDPAGSAGAGLNMTSKATAKDATVNIDGIAVRSSTNTVSGAIAGVTLTLLKEAGGTTASLAVNRTGAAAAAAVSGFVKSFNDVQATIGNLTKYDATNKKASVLTGDATVRTVQSQLRSLIGGTIAGPLGDGPTSLAQIGIRTDGNGALVFDQAKFNTAYAANPDGVERLFASVSSATDSLVSVKTSGSKIGTGSYALTVDQLATRTTLAGSAAAGLAITAGVNDALTVTLSGVTATITLPERTYATAAALAADVASRINGAAAFASAGLSVSIAESGGVLTFTSGRYGSGSSVGVDGSAAATLLGGAPVTTTGKDVAGSLNGIAMSGSGQLLSGPASSVLEGLTLTIQGGSTGARGTVSYSEGIAARLSRVVDSLIDAEGLVAARAAGVQRSIDAIDKRSDALQRRLDIVEAAYYKQYQTLDTTLASLSTQAMFLTQQIDMIKANSGSGS